MSNDMPLLKFDGFQNAMAKLTLLFRTENLTDERAEQFEVYRERFEIQDGALFVTPSIVAGCTDGETTLTFDELDERVERYKRGVPQ